MKTILVLIITCVSLTAAYCQTSEDYYNRGHTKTKQLQDYRGDIADFTKAIELDPNHAQAYLFRGASKGKLQDHMGAMADYTKAIELDPNDEQAYYCMTSTKSVLLKG